MVETRREPQSVGSNNNLSFKLHVNNRAASKGKWRMKFNDWFWCLYGITWYYIVLRGKLPLAMHAKVLPGSVQCELNHTVWPVRHGVHILYMFLWSKLLELWKSGVPSGGYVFSFSTRRHGGQDDQKRGWQEERMVKMKQLPATASAAHDWAHLTHGAADPKN